ncbi:hypothetical protein [Novosphingobium sp. BL-52-GroH]|uniref:hypothetical protein n=1 Tax=Novosphingobium sp. BL-52-GroH TaxID=3349877 RepID=UPI00384D473F
MTFDDLERDRIAACRELIAARAFAAEHLRGVLTHDRSWDAMQRLYLATLERKEFLQSWFAPEVPANAHRIASRLRSLGLIATSIDPRDHRRILVNLTKQGQTAMEAVIDYLLCAGFARG